MSTLITGQPRVFNAVMTSSPPKHPTSVDVARQLPSFENLFRHLSNEHISSTHSTCSNPSQRAAESHHAAFGSLNSINIRTILNSFDSVTLRRVMESAPPGLCRQFPLDANRDDLLVEVLHLRQTEAVQQATSKPNIKALSILLDMSAAAVLTMSSERPENLFTLMTDALRADPSLQPHSLPYNNSTALAAIALTWKYNVFTATLSTYSPDCQTTLQDRCRHFPISPQSQLATNSETQPDDYPQSSTEAHNTSSNCTQAERLESHVDERIQPRSSRNFAATVRSVVGSSDDARKLRTPTLKAPRPQTPSRPPQLLRRLSFNPHVINESKHRPQAPRMARSLSFHTPVEEKIYHYEREPSDTVYDTPPSERDVSSSSEESLTAEDTLQEYPRCGPQVADLIDRGAMMGSDILSSILRQGSDVLTYFEELIRIWKCSNPEVGHTGEIMTLAKIVHIELLVYDSPKDALRDRPALEIAFRRLCAIVLVETGIRNGEHSSREEAWTGARQFLDDYGRENRIDRPT